MKQNLSSIFSSAATSLDLAVDERELNCFKIYCRELLLWNRRTNLVSIKSPSDIWSKHFLDSLTPIPFFNKEGGKLLDIGTGAGFPGIPLKILLNSLTLFLLDSSRKKISFLKHIIRNLQLDGVEIIHGRVEDLIKEGSYRNMFDIVISRASFKLPQLIKMGAFFLSPNGTLIAMKGKDVREELEAAKDSIKISNLKFVDCHDLRLPITGDKRKIIIFKKDLQ